ncbi:uncharacterized protein PHACADRAFT_253405 [Phanerochaete carnosa HHB-10118-sp]|uniref:Uncharacterized protein n=1 Tax=Phanerochaete carnosa (strain HHB-10118-sp) TaxID=650164 RepID=K5WAW6_PHACS|nr:uncharacterized protein PHACADRAFT_253405 [Phanerochaete carnosa HHB-10118-sp]EKM56330.1 hypothetical protein PHACADRAFT_253405 [Phanerochaete carnosa HHB-10118-sp]
MSPWGCCAHGDSTIAKLDVKPKVLEEVPGMRYLLKNWTMLSPPPISFASNHFYAYRGNISTPVNGTTRTLNASLEGTGALMIGPLVLDSEWMLFRHRSLLDLAVVVVQMIVV